MALGKHAYSVVPLFVDEALSCVERLLRRISLDQGMEEQQSDSGVSRSVLASALSMDRMKSRKLFCF
ncbi:hypothetical protein [Pajaroellobacter abortibovis]|nr:hypothetical protein [Pajaroellobacter abortibovis]